MKFSCRSPSVKPQTFKLHRWKGRSLLNGIQAARQRNAPLRKSSAVCRWNRHSEEELQSKLPAAGPPPEEKVEPQLTMSDLDFAPGLVLYFVDLFASSADDWVEGAYRRELKLRQNQKFRTFLWCTHWDRPCCRVPYTPPSWWTSGHCRQKQQHPEQARDGKGFRSVPEPGRTFVGTAQPAGLR